MKNVFFTVAFMLLGAFAFASNEVEENTHIDLEKIESLLHVDEVVSSENNLQELYCGFTISFSTDEGSGSFWYDCSGDDSGNSNLLADLLECLFWDCDWSNGW